MRQTVYACLVLLIAMNALPGCASSSSTSVQATDRFGPERVTTETVNAMVIAFADDHVARIIEAADRLRIESPELRDRKRLNTIALKNTTATVAIASSTNPLVAMTDMLVMVSLSREALRRSAIDTTLTPEQRLEPASYAMTAEELAALFDGEKRLLYRAFQNSEREIRSLGTRVFYPEQLEDLDALIDAWWQENPARRLVAHVRLQDFAGLRAASVQTVTSGPRNLLGLLALDPLASMDPTTREIAQSRMAAERITYQVNRLPLVVAMYARGLMYETLSIDEVVQAGETLRGAEAALARFAEAVDEMPEDLAAEREAAIADIEAAFARQREETLLAIETRTEPLQKTLSELSATLTSATALGVSVNDTVRDIDEMDVENFQHLAESTTEAVAAIERSLVTLERLLTPDETEATSRLDRSVNAAATSTTDLVDHIFRRGLLLAAIVLAGWVVAALILKFLAGRIARPS